MFALAALGCSGLFPSSAQGDGTGPMPTISNAVRALKVRVLDDMGFVAEGDTDPRLNERVKAAVQAELGRQGLTILQGQDRTPDVDIRMEIRVNAAVYFLHGHLALTAENDGIAVAVVATGDEFHRDSDFPVVIAQEAVDSLLHSPGLAEFAEKKNPRLLTARQEVRVASAPVEAKPTQDAMVSAKDFYNQGTRHYELGHYQDALTSFESAYMAVPDAAFLFNIGQCHRKMGHDKEAVSFYKSYLRNAPNAPNRADVQKRIQELEDGKHN
jgi:hypothetical protein